MPKKEKEIPYDYKDYVKFREAIGMRESSNDYTVVNKYGYLGKYQFGLARLTDFWLCTRIDGTRGYSNKSFRWVTPFSEESFLGTPELQDVVFSEHVRGHIQTIYRNFGMYLDQDIYKVRVTLSGVVACLHLLGVGGFKDFLAGKASADANGTSAANYLEKFAGYELPNDLPVVHPLTMRAMVLGARNS